MRCRAGDARRPPKPFLLLILTLLAALLGPAGCANRPVPPPAAVAPAAAEIQVVGRGWHTDISLPVAALGPALGGLAGAFPGARHLVFGFGDRGYLLDRNPSPFRALWALLPGPGVILLTALAAPPDVAFGAANVVSLPLSRHELDRLQRFIADSLAWDAAGDGKRASPPIAEGPYPGSVFHASSVTYAATYTCNTWTAEALAVAGLPVSVTGVLFAGQLMGRVRRAAARRPAADRPG